MNDCCDLICILGPTAIGKTALAALLAYTLDGEIISADSRQVYRGLNIGAGKDLHEYKVKGIEIPYHLIDIVNLDTEYNLYRYQQDFKNAYSMITTRDRLPILCGGAGLYLDAVLSGYHLVEAPVNQELRTQLQRMNYQDQTALLEKYSRLHNITDTQDPDRLLRAIEIALYTAESSAASPFPTITSHIYGMALEPELLNQRITERLTRRLDQGLIEEVENLLKLGVSAERLHALGLEYRYITLYLQGELTRGEMIQKLNSAIKDFAKRQRKWFRRMERKGKVIMWLDAAKPLQTLVSVIIESSRLIPKRQLTPPQD